MRSSRLILSNTCRLRLWLKTYYDDKCSCSYWRSVAAQAPPKNISTSRRTSKDESSLSQSIEAIGVHTIEEGKPLSQVRHRRPFASLESIWDAAENTFIPLSCLEVDIDAELSSEVFANSKRSIFHLMEYDCYIRFMGKQDKNELSELSRKSDVRSTSVWCTCINISARFVWD